SGCTLTDENSEVESISGEKGQELSCISAGWAHNLVLQNIEGDGMTVELFGGADCSSSITKMDTDGCKVIPSDTVIAAARILPK
ncbi:hypothetical protein QBC35DRAFT_391607, partial [Podospora australis]